MERPATGELSGPFSGLIGVLSTTARSAIVPTARKERMSDTISQRQKQDPAEVIARALAVAAHQHLLGTARWEKWTPDAKAAIAALEAAGYAVVPVEPTAEMNCVLDDDEADRALQDPDWRRIVWRAMVAARPGR
jgi:hypothetical protein